jgi:PIN domain nuclease of toxin-antitoxin system
MKFLLDTPALIWLLEDDGRLEAQARAAIIDPGNDVFVSIVSFWEIAIKMRIGKLGGTDLEKVMEAVTAHGLELLHLEPRHIAELIKLPFHPDHRDPFDHQLIAQAITDDLVFISEDLNAQRYPVRRMSCSDAEEEKEPESCRFEREEISDHQITPPAHFSRRKRGGNGASEETEPESFSPI